MHIMRPVLLSVLLFSFLCIAAADNNENSLAEIENGVQIQGYRTKTINNREFSSFRAIPYAEPPTGKRRFKSTEPKVWTSKTFDATKEGPECPQTDEKNTDVIRGAEDCLTLNVYTHNTSKPLRKVMVYIHGGFYIQGNSSKYGPDRLLDKDVVLITLNYRLGVLGFMGTEDEASPGNYGLLDQTEALKWVQRNIEAFGGDPNEVTLFGESAGSTFVFCHYISKVSQGLFHRAIAQSVNVINSVGEQSDPMKWTTLIAKSLNCACSDNKRMVECLKQVPVKRLIEASQMATNGLIAFGPVNDGHFFTDLPSKLLRAGKIANPKVPLMFGMTHDEGLYFVLSLFAQPQKLTDQFISTIMGLAFNSGSQNVPIDVVKAVRKQYFSSPNISDQNVLMLTTAAMATDYLFFIPLIQAAQSLIKHGVKPFLYSFDYVTDHSVLRTFGIDTPLGVAHSDDLSFAFDVYDFFPSVFHTPNDNNEAEFLDIWTNFAETGIPTEETSNGEVEWKPAQTGEINIYHMNNNITLQVYQPKDDWKYDFWVNKIPAILNARQCEHQYRKRISLPINL